MLLQTMTRQPEKIDTIKTYVRLIKNLKNHEQINLDNKLLRTDLKNVSNRQIKLLLEIESLHYDERSRQQIKQIARNINKNKGQSKIGSQQHKFYSFLLIKLLSISLVKAIKSDNGDYIPQLSLELFQHITTIEEYRYILQVIFHFRSVLSLQAVDADKIWQRYGSSKEGHHILYAIALVKATDNPQQAVEILTKLRQNPKVLEVKKHLVTFLAELGKRQRCIMQKRGENFLEKSLIQIDQNTKKTIINSIESQCKISIKQDNRTETFNKINTNTDQSIYLYAFPLTHLYFQKNPYVIEAVRPTGLYKYLINSSDSKTKTRREQNPLAYEVYLKLSDHLNQTVCIPLCKKGLNFVKHNYGNLNYSKKLVRVTDDSLEYYKTTNSSDSGTKWNFSEVLGVLYGRVTPRHLESEVESECCFSVVLRDRTFDLSVERERIPEMFNFINGMSSLLNRYHKSEKNSAEQKLQKLKEVKKSKLRELKAAIAYHQGKVQKFTKGRMLWSELILSLNKKILFRQHQKPFYKMEGIKKVVAKISSTSMNKL